MYRVVEDVEDASAFCAGQLHVSNSVDTGQLTLYCINLLRSACFTAWTHQSTLHAGWQCMCNTLQAPLPVCQS